MNFPPINVKTFLHLALTLFHHFVIAYIATSEFLSILQLATVFLVYSACSFIVFDNLFERWFFCFQLKCLSAPFILEITCLETKTGFVYVCVCVTCVCLSVYMCIVRMQRPWRPEGDVRAPGAGIIRYCEPPKVGAGNQTQLLWKSSIHSRNS